MPTMYAPSIEKSYNVELDDDEYISKWLQNRKSSTQKYYRRAMVLYSQFLREKSKPMTPKKMLIV